MQMNPITSRYQIQQLPKYAILLPSAAGDWTTQQPASGHMIKSQAVAGLKVFQSYQVAILKF